MFDNAPNVSSYIDALYVVLIILILFSIPIFNYFDRRRNQLRNFHEVKNLLDNVNLDKYALRGTVNETIFQKFLLESPFGYLANNKDMEVVYVDSIKYAKIGSLSKAYSGLHRFIDYAKGQNLLIPLCFGFRQLSYYYLVQGYYTTSEILLKNILRVYDKKKFYEGVDDCLFRLVTLYIQSNNLSKLNKLKKKYYNKGMPENGGCRNLIYGAYFFIKGNYASALDYVNSWKRDGILLGEQLGLYHNICSEIYYELQEYGISLDHAQRSLKIYRKAGYKFEAARILRLLAAIKYATLDYDEALKHCKAADSIFSRFEAVIELANVSIIAEQILVIISQKELVPYYYEGTLSIYKNRHFTFGMAQINFAYAIMIIESHEEAEVIRYFRKARNLFEEADSKIWISKVLQTLGDYYLSNKKPQKSIKEYKKALKIAEKNEFSTEIAKIKNKLSTLYAIST